MKFKRFALTLASSMLLAFQGQLSFAAPQNEPSISGGFIQFDGTTKNVSKESWQKLLQQCKSAGINKLILQYCSHTNENADPPMYFDKEIDNITAVAEELHMDVYIGLAYANEWFAIENELDSASGPKVPIARANFAINSPWVVTTTASAQRIHDKYKGLSCFKGYYIPQELDDRVHQDDNQEEFISVFKTISQKCKELDPDKDVLVSVFCSEISRASEAKTENFYSRFLKETKIPILLVQDSVGKMGWKTADLSDNLSTFFNPFIKAGASSGAKIWADVECFQNPKAPVPCDSKRLNEQLKIESKDLQVDKLVVFDLNHYLDPIDSTSQTKLLDSIVSLKPAQ
ncbi:MAG TPA: DUF4434 domain-containing protein [Drouetiella sp.]